MKKRKYFLGMALAFILICSGMVIAASSIAKAAEETQPIKTEGLDKDKYLQYAENYKFDSVEHKDFMDVTTPVLNMITNVMFDGMKKYALVTSLLAYHALDFNLAEYFSDEINAIQGTLRDSVFEPLFFIGFAGCAIVILKRLLKRDLIGMYGQFAKVIIIFMLSLLVVNNSAAVIKSATGLTTAIGASILYGEGSIQRVPETTAEYALSTAGNIWYNMAHLPWEYVEFGNDSYTEDDVLEILQRKRGEEIRQNKVEGWEGTAFQPERAAERLGFLLLYMIPLAIKCTIYIVLEGMLFLFQFMEVVYVLLAPFVLILAMFPNYEYLIGLWVRKFIEAQVSALVMYFIVGVLFMTDNLLYTNVSKQWGWLVVLVVQCVLYVGVILKYNDILGMFNKHGIPNPQKPINAVVNTAKSMAIRSISAVGNLGAKATVSHKGGGLARAAGKKTIERPVMKKAELAPYSSKGNAQYSNGATSSEPHREPLRPTRVAFVERQIVFDFEPFEEREEAYNDKSIQRPRMDVPEYWEANSTSPIPYPEQVKNVSEKQEKSVQPRVIARTEVNRNARKARTK